MKATGGAVAREVRIGIIGGGLMGRELMALVGRWPVLVDHPVRPIVTALADPSPSAQAWFESAGVSTVTDDYQRLLSDPDIDVLYIAVPHHLHEKIYLDAIGAGKDFLGEKPFGIDLPSANRIVAAIDSSSVFVRVSSEMPFFPGAQRAYEYAQSGALGEIIEVRAGLLHSSDVNRDKPINWKRQRKYCGEIGVMGDLGMHVAHLPLRLDWVPKSVYALLDDIVPTRKNAEGQDLLADTFDNATLSMKVATARTDGRSFPMQWETKRIAPGHSNSWYFEALGMDGGVRFNTRTPTTHQIYSIVEGEQRWSEIQPGYRSVWPTVTGAIFEFGFTDALLQMWATFLAEREGALGVGFGTATVHEARASHKVFAAALGSHASNAAVEVDIVG
jgi:predicted dehydrogenase